MTTIDTAVLGSSRDTAMVSALLRGGSYSEVAIAARCSRSTVVRRMRNPEFRARINDLRAEMLSRVTDVLAAETLGSVATLASVRDDPAVAPTVRVRAASALLAAAIKYQADDLQQRNVTNDPAIGFVDVTDVERRLSESIARFRDKLPLSLTDPDELAGTTTMRSLSNPVGDAELDFSYLVPWSALDYELGPVGW